MCFIKLDFIQVYGNGYQIITPEEQKPKIWNMPGDKTDLR